MTHGKELTKYGIFISIDPCLKTTPDLEDFWTIESVGITDRVKRNEDEIGIDTFKGTVRFKENRCRVTWPWRDEDVDLPVNSQ